jgi:KUP system potassium uptake protein
MITLAISVLAAVEGTSVALPTLQEWVIPIAAAILIGLFAIQSRGTAAVGNLFGPVMLVWFGVLAVLGVVHLMQEPSVLRAVTLSMPCGSLPTTACRPSCRWELCSSS